MSDTSESRVVLAIPPMLGDIVKNILKRANDVILVAELGADDDLLAATRARNADLVITGLDDDELPHACAVLLEANAHVKVLALCGDGSDAYLYELRPELHRLGELSPGQLVSAIREATT